MVRINGQNVSRSIADSVAKIIRQSEKQIILDLQRQIPHKDHRHDPDIAQRTSLATISEQDNVIPETNRIVCKVDIEPTPSTSSDDSSMDLSHDSSRDSSHSSSSSHDPLIELGDWESPRSVKVGTRPDVEVRYQDLSEGDQERQSAIQKLLLCEEQFVSRMQFAIQRYSNPLRHKFVSPSEHGTLFQNVEKLVSISEYHVYKMKEDSRRYSDVKGPPIDVYLDTIGSIYLPKVR